MTPQSDGKVGNLLYWIYVIACIRGSYICRCGVWPYSAVIYLQSTDISILSLLLFCEFNEQSLQLYHHMYFHKSHVLSQVKIVEIYTMTSASLYAYLPGQILHRARGYSHLDRQMQNNPIENQIINSSIRHWTHRVLYMRQEKFSDLQIHQMPSLRHTPFLTHHTSTPKKLHIAKILQKQTTPRWLSQSHELPLTTAYPTLS